MNQQHAEYMRRHRKQKRAYAAIERARKKDPNAYPLAPFCETCPDDDKRAAEEMHHFDYEYPHIYASLCSSCHKWNHKNPPTPKGRLKSYSNAKNEVTAQRSRRVSNGN